MTVVTFSEPLQAEIIGPIYVTVGVPSSFECDANCTACAYSMSLDGQNQVQGNVLAFTVDKWTMGLTVSCIVTDEITDLTATVTKRLLVLGIKLSFFWTSKYNRFCTQAFVLHLSYTWLMFVFLTLVGPANVSISGPELMSPTATSTYICQASCRPSCSYTWKIDQGPWIGGQPNSLSVHPREADNITALTCKATNTVSGLFVSTTRKIIMISKSRVHKIYKWGERSFRQSWLINTLYCTSSNLQSFKNKHEKVIVPWMTTWGWHLMWAQMSVAWLPK